MGTYTLKKQLKFSAVKALVVDDAAESRLILSELLKQTGYEVLEAVNGLEAIELFKTYKPDIIFMDVLMPIMDGYQATRDIKALSKDDFIPIIFVTTLDKEEDLETCINAGGDDFLSKPFTKSHLKSKILSLERIRGVYRRIKELNQTLITNNDISENIFKRIIFTKNTPVKTIKSWFTSETQTGNDIFLVKHTPANGLNILLGNFNTPGPASIFGALPCSEVFRSMTEKGFSPKDILDGINNKLVDILPTGIHMSAIFVNINEQLTQIQICNLSMPNVFLVSDQTKSIAHTIKSENKFLGENNKFDSRNLIEKIEINKQYRIILCGNGVLNSQNISFEKFGAIRHQQSIENGIKNQRISASITSDLRDFTQSSQNAQALSIIEIPCSTDLIPSHSKLITDIKHQKNKVNINPNNVIDFELTINGKNLINVDPVPMLINFLQELTIINSHQDILFTIFTELYVNALEHGILGLESNLKNLPNGFAKYFNEKEKRIRFLEDGFIKIKLSFESGEKTNHLHFFIEDSGPGFDFQSAETQQESNNLLSGRGITLVRALCDSFEFHQSGNQSTSTYSWPVK